MFEEKLQFLFSLCQLGLERTLKKNCLLYRLCIWGICLSIFYSKRVPCYWLLVNWYSLQRGAILFIKCSSCTSAIANNGGVVGVCRMILVLRTHEDSSSLCANLCIQTVVIHSVQVDNSRLDKNVGVFIFIHNSNLLAWKYNFQLYNRYQFFLFLFFVKALI